MSAIVAVGQRQIHTLIITQIHRPTDQCFYSMYIVGNRISDILDLTTVAQFPESSFQILFLDRSNILSYVAVETVAHIRTVGYPAHDTVHLAELLYLQTAKALSRCSVNCIQDLILFFVYINLIIDITKHFQCKFSVFGNGFTIVKFLQFVQCCDTEGGCHRTE